MFYYCLPLGPALLATICLSVWQGMHEWHFRRLSIGVNDMIYHGFSRVAELRCLTATCKPYVATWVSEVDLILKCKLLTRSTRFLPFSSATLPSITRHPRPFRKAHPAPPAYAHRPSPPGSFSRP